MNGDPLDPDYTTPAEVRLSEHLMLLRSDPPRSDRALVVVVLRAARWQRAAREPLLALGRLAAAVFNGIHGLVQTRARRRL
ncbi:MAG: hypothetical protein M3071_09215 [Actinomycetota bacterium]|nr:hypothetical protein [Actinomycetota bacterium]